jgi:Zn-finger nucleic acid-binding protein
MFQHSGQANAAWALLISEREQTVKCPKDSSELRKQSRRGIEAECCPTCEGMWLDSGELDQLEDAVFDEDDYKGTLIFADQPSERHCPHCVSSLKQFRYRLYDLVVEHCPNKHGFWLDADEDRRVVALMEQRSTDMERKYRAEEEWSRTLQRLKSPSFFDKLINLFR